MLVEESATYATTVSPSQEHKKKKAPASLNCGFCGASNTANEMFCVDCAKPLDAVPNQTPKDTVMLKVSTGQILQLQMEKGYAYFGRDHTHTLDTISDPYVSSIHCVFFYIKQQLYVQDVSTNGLQLNDQQLERGRLYPLDVGHCLTMQSVLLEVVQR